MINTDDEGILLSDNGVICFPDIKNGEIERIDVWGNRMESRYPEDDNYEDWNRLFEGTEHYYTRTCSKCKQEDTYLEDGVCEDCWNTRGEEE